MSSKTSVGIKHKNVLETNKSTSFITEKRNIHIFLTEFISAERVEITFVGTNIFLV